MAAPSGVKNFYRHSQKCTPDTVLLCGCGKGEEIPVMRKLWPQARIIGVEPLTEHWAEMRKHDREPDVMVRGAVYHTEDVKLVFHLNFEPDQRATIYNLPGVHIEDEITRDIWTVSIDGLAERYGPFQNTLLWMDVEGAEYEALRCCRTLIGAAGGIEWISVEMNFAPPRNIPEWTEVNALLESYGYRMQSLHSVSRNGRQADGFYIPQAKWDQRRKAVVERSMQRKLERLAAGRGKLGSEYETPEEMIREEINGNHRHPGPA